MLPSTSRLRRSRDITETVRHGARGGRPLLVVHLDLPADATDDPSRPGVAPRAGFVVSRAVGGSVVRHTVTRRLRHLVRTRLAHLPAGARLVVRALPASAHASSAQLAEDLDRALHRALDRARATASAAARP